jgi:anthranilate synthase component I
MTQAKDQLKTATIISMLADVETPVSAFHKLSSNFAAGFLFESSESDTRLARFSIMGVDPIKTITLKNGTATICNRTYNSTQEIKFNDPLKLLKDELTEFKSSIAPSKPLLDLPFAGGLVGYLGYAITQYFEGIPQQKSDPFNVPDGFYGLYDSVIIFDHLLRLIHIISYRGNDHAKALESKLLADSHLPSLKASGFLSNEELFENVTGPFTQDSFMDVVKHAKEYIIQGEVFQIVVSHRFSQPIKSDALTIYRILQAINPSPYAYFLKCPDFTYLGSSPETFVRAKNGDALLRALAGTRPRGSTEEEDIELAHELQNDEKELAEHRMLVDLGRNDLGRICQVGTVKVGEIAQITRYSHVMHLATDVTGKLSPEKDCFDLLRACFPRGTVSGAPKIRAMQLLANLEPEQRGIYSGTVGYFDCFGNTDGAIAIRSAVIKDGYAHVNAGAGIVYDSDPLAEFNETCNKAKSVLTAIKMAERLN